MSIRIVPHNNTELRHKEIRESCDFIITSNSSMKDLYTDFSEMETSKIESFDRFERKGLYQKWYDPTFEIQVISMVNKLLSEGDYAFKDQMIHDSQEIMKAIRWLVVSGINQIDENFVNLYKHDFIDLFNKLMNLEPVRSEQLKLNKLSEFEQLIKAQWKRLEVEREIKSIGFVNIDRLSIQRIRTIYLLDYMGYEVKLYIPTQTTHGVLNECWYEDYEKIGLFDKTSKMDIQSKLTAFLTNTPMSNFNMQKNVKRIEFLSPYDFKKYIRKNKEMEFYAFDHDYINHRFDKEMEKDHGFTFEAVRFWMLLVNVKTAQQKVYLEFDELIELLNSGWIQVKSVNIEQAVSFLMECENYFKGATQTRHFIARLKNLKKFENLNKSFENHNAELIDKEPIAEFLSNPFRVFSFNQIDKYAVTIDEIITLIQKLEHRVLELHSLRNKDGFYKLIDVINMIKSEYEKNAYMQQLAKTNTKFKTYMHTLVYTKLEYNYDNLTTDEIITYIAYQCGGETTHNVCHNYEHLDRALYFRDKVIHITDMSYRALRNSNEKTHDQTHIFGMGDIKHFAIKKGKSKTFLNILEIASSNQKNSHHYRRQLLVNLLESYDGMIEISYIKNLEVADVKCSDFLIIENLYKDKKVREWHTLKEKYEPDLKRNDAKQSVISKVSNLPEVSFRDLDFCNLKFFMNNVVNNYPIYRDDFHQRLSYMNICGYMKGVQLVYNEPTERYKDLQEFVLPLFPQWLNVDKRDMLYKSFQAKERSYKAYKTMEYPKYIDKMQILWSKYLVTKKWRLKNRYNKSTINVLEEAEKFAENIDDVEQSGGRHCMYCSLLTTCTKGVHLIDRR